MNTRAKLQHDDLLTRTPEGTRELSARSTDLSPKLRSVLFLVTGRLAVGELLERAGPMKAILEGQLLSLIEMGLVAIVGIEIAPRMREDDVPAAAASEMPPVAGAKIELLKSLEASGSCEATLLADELLDARTLRELAVSAREIAYRLRDADGNAVAEAFWSEAKRILLAWRDLGTAIGR